MDDVIPQSESQSLMHPPSNGVDADGGEGKAANGVLGHLKIPSLNTEAEDEEAGEKDEEKSGGLITSFINLVSPKSTKSGEFAKRKVEDEVEAGEIVNGNKTCAAEQAGENGGGGISNIISGFFSPSEEGDKETEKVKDGGNKRLKMDEEEEEGTGTGTGAGAGAGGLIDIIVSHLPKSLPDDAAPTTDEASILIHSLVKD